ncbi:MAG: hypothetical protein ABID35_03540 [Candidatus Margulisiibacteriota bacterium]
MLTHIFLYPPAKGEVADILLRANVALVFKEFEQKVLSADRQTTDPPMSPELRDVVNATRKVRAGDPTYIGMFEHGIERELVDPVTLVKTLAGFIENYISPSANSN